MFHLIDHFYPIESDLCLSNWWSLSGRPDEWAIHRSWKKTGAAAPQSLLSLEKLFWWVITPRHRHTTSKRKYLVFWESVGGSFDVVNSHMSSSWTQKSFVHQVIWWYRTWGWDNELFWRRVENSIKIPNCQNTRFQGHHCQLGRRYSATWLFNIYFWLLKCLPRDYQHYIWNAWDVWSFVNVFVEPVSRLIIRDLPRVSPRVWAIQNDAIKRPTRTLIIKN